MLYKKTLISFAVALGLFCIGGSALAETKGVTDKEIVVATLQDLSGPIASISKTALHGIQMRINEANEAGGINGRKIRLLVEDHGYDPKKTLLATQKLIEKEDVFAIIGTMGTPTNMAALPILLENNVFSLFPICANRAMYEPLNDFKYGYAVPNRVGIRLAVKYFVKSGGYHKICSIYQDDEFGQDVLAGFHDALKELGITPCEITSYKRGATDFSSQVAKLKAAGCDLVVLGATVREPVSIMKEANKVGWKPVFLGASACMTPLVHKLGGDYVEGLFALSQFIQPYADTDNKGLKTWFHSYMKRFNGEEPDTYSIWGYLSASLFVSAIEKTGAELTPKNFIKTMQSLSYGPDIFAAEYKYTKDDHLGVSGARIMQIRNGRWVSVSDMLR